MPSDRKGKVEFVVDCDVHPPPAYPPNAGGYPVIYPTTSNRSITQDVDDSQEAFCQSRILVFVLAMLAVLSITALAFAVLAYTSDGSNSDRFNEIKEEVRRLNSTQTSIDALQRQLQDMQSTLNDLQDRNELNEHAKNLNTTQQSVAELQQLIWDLQSSLKGMDGQNRDDHIGFADKLSSLEQQTSNQESAFRSMAVDNNRDHTDFLSQINTIKTGARSGERKIASHTTAIDALKKSSVTRLSTPRYYFGGHTYFVGNGIVNWWAAENFCMMQGGHLVSIGSQSEQNFIISTVISSREIQTRYGGYARNNGVWIGISDIDSENVWKWSDGSRTSYRNWLRGEPNNSKGEDCGEIYLNRGIQWNDKPCRFFLPFICEIA